MQRATEQRRTDLEASWCRTQVTRAPEGTGRLPVAGEAAEGSWLDEAENTLYLPAAVTVATAQPSADNMACVGASPPPPSRHVFFDCREADDTRVSSLREDRHRTENNGVSWMYMRRMGQVCGGWEGGGKWRGGGGGGGGGGGEVEGGGAPASFPPHDT